MLDGANFRWWIGGGHAFELHLGDEWRRHEDLDVGICRYQVDIALAWFTDWEIYAAHAGRLIPWASPQRVENPNNIWLRRGPGEPWALDLTVGEGTASEWVYRRDVAVRRPWDRAVLLSETGTPYLAPELQLLFKSKDPREKDWVDARRVIPHLHEDQRQFLRAHLADDHDWQELMD